MAAPALAAGPPATGAPAANAAAAGAPSAGSPQARAAVAGLYGAGDPAQDGVVRQALALLAMAAAGRNPDPAAIRTLVDQQCPDGAWTSWRTDPARPCEPGREDVVATAYAAQALGALGVAAQAPPLRWLRVVQNADGGFPRRPGGRTDPLATGLAVSAVVAQGGTPAGRSWLRPDGGPYDVLVAALAPCTGPARGGVAGSDGTVDRQATSAAALGLLGQALPLAPVDPTITPSVPRCTDVTTPRGAAGPLARAAAAERAVSSLGSGQGLTAPQDVVAVALARVAAGTVAASDVPTTLVTGGPRPSAELLAWSALLAATVDPAAAAPELDALERSRGSWTPPVEELLGRPAPGSGVAPLSVRAYWLVAGSLVVVATVLGARIGRRRRGGGGSSLR